MSFLCRCYCVVAALCGAVCAPAAAQTLTAVMHTAMRITDPVVSTGNISTFHGYMIYDTLLGVDEHFNIRPQMADWQVSEDGKRYVFTLREGLRWHDGAPVRSEDCIASIARWAQVDTTGQMLMPLVEDIQALDDQRFEVRLTSPTPLLLEGFAKISARALFIMPKRVAQTPPTEPVTEHVGSGPFKFVVDEFQPGVKAVYEKNTDYVPRAESPSWTAGGKVVHVARVEWLGMPDPMTAVSALQQGEIDFIEQLPLDLLPILKERADIRVHVLDKLGYLSFMRMNHLHPPFDDKRLRRAAMLAIAQADILHAAMGNPAYYRPCAAVMGCDTLLADTYGEDWLVPARMDEARALLAEANYDGTPVVILQPTDLAAIKTHPIVIAAALRQAGFKVELKAMDWQTLSIQRNNPHPVSEGGWNLFASSANVSITHNPISNNLLAAAGRASWYGWPDVPEIEALRARFARTAEPAERRAIAADLQRLAIDEGVFMPMGQILVTAAYRRVLRDMPEAPVMLFWGVKKVASPS